MISLGGFQEVSSGDVKVRLDYGKAQICGECSGPFAWVHKNRSRIDPVIDSEEVIRLMRPPLEFRERRCLFIFVAISVALILTTTFSFLAYAGMTGKRSRGEPLNPITYMFVGAILFLVLFEFGSIGFWMCRFRQKLIAYVNDLNVNKLHPQGVHFYYDDYCCGCFGKNTGRLGIRRWNPQVNDVW